MSDHLTEISLDSITNTPLSPARVRDLVMGTWLMFPVRGARLPTEKEMDVIGDMLKEAVQAGRFFDFGYWPNNVIKETSRRSGQLYNQGALGHPFTQPWIYLHSWSTPESDAEGYPPVWAGYLVNPLLKKDEAPTGVDFEVIGFEGFNIKGRDMLGLNDRAILTPDINNPTVFDCNVIPSGIRYLDADDPEYQRVINNNVSPQRAAAANVLDPTIMALTLLNMRGVPRERVSPDAKLQRARAKAGKLPLPSYDRVYSDEYITAVQARQNHKSRSDGHHSSPIPHIRMGHWRHYSTGERSFIRDTLVNVREETRATFRSTRSHYTIKE